MNSCPKRGSSGVSYSTFDIGFRPIVAGRTFLMPTTLAVFVRDGRRISRNYLFSRSSLRRLSSGIVRRKGFRKCLAGPIGPTAVVLNDFICDLSHELLPL